MNLLTQTHTFHVRIVYDWKIHNIFRYFNICRVAGAEGNIWT